MHTDSSGHTHDHAHGDDQNHAHPHVHSNQADRGQSYDRSSDRAVEQALSEMAQQSRLLEAYMNDILTKEATVTRLITEAHLASEAIQQLSSTNEDESLVPIGIGVFLKVTVPQVRNLLVNVGSGVTIEKSKENAKDSAGLALSCKIPKLLSEIIGVSELEMRNGTCKH